VISPRLVRPLGLLSTLLLGAACAVVFFGGVRPAASKGRELVALRERLRAQCDRLRVEAEDLGRERTALQTDWFYNERLRRLGSREGAASWGR